MWTADNRPRYNRDKLRYPSDLTDAEWTHIEPLIPPGKPGGGKRRVAIREVINGVMYILSTGCQWRWPLPTKGATGVSMRRWPSGSAPSAMTLYVDEELGLELTNTGYALDSTTIASVPVGLTVGAVPRPPRPRAKPCPTACIDLRGNSQSVIQSAEKGKLASTFMPTICSCRMPEPSTSWIKWLRRLCRHVLCRYASRGLLRHACQVEHRCSSRLFADVQDRSTGGHLRPDHLPGRPCTPVRITPNFCGEIRFKPTAPSQARRRSSSPTTSRFRPASSARSTKDAGRWNSSSSGSSSIFG